MAKMKIFLLCISIFLLSCESSVVHKSPLLVLDWKYEGFAEPISIGVSGSGRCIAVSSISGTELAMLYEDSNTPVWHLEIPVKPGPDLNFAPFIFGSRIVTFAGNALRCFQLETGDELWSLETQPTTIGPESFSQPSNSDKQIFAGSASGFLYSIDLFSGLGNWTQTSRYEGFGPTTYAGGRVLVKTLASKIECRNVIQGRIFWQNTHWILPDESLTADENNVYLATPGPNVVAIRIKNGQPAWQHIKGKFSPIPLKSSPLIWGDELLVIEGKTVYRFNKKTGEALGNLELPEMFKCLEIGGELLFAVNGSRLQAYDMSGKLLNVFNEPEGDELGGIVIMSNHIITWSPRVIYALGK